MAKSTGPFAGLTRNVFVLGFVSLLTDMASEMVVPLLPRFLRSALGAGPAVIGIISGLSESAASFLKLLSGWLSDRLGKRKALVLIGYGIAAIARPLMGLATSWWHVLAVRVIDRTGKGIRIAPRDALLADSCDEAVRGRAFGFQQMADNIGAAIGPLLALALLVWVTQDYRVIFFLSVIPGLLVLLAGAAIVENPSVKRSEPARLSLAPFDRRFKTYLFATFLFHLAVASDFFVILRMDEARFTDAELLLTWSGYCIVSSVSAMAGGWISDHTGRHATLRVSWLCFVLLWAALAYVPPGWIALPVLAFGVFGGVARGPRGAFVADLVPANLRGTAYGLFNCALGLATLFGNIAFGIIWQQWSAKAAFLAGTGVALLGLVALALVPATVRSSDPCSPA